MNERIEEYMDELERSLVIEIFKDFNAIPYEMKILIIGFAMGVNAREFPDKA